MYTVGLPETSELLSCETCPAHYLRILLQIGAIVEWSDLLLPIGIAESVLARSWAYA